MKVLEWILHVFPGISVLTGLMILILPLMGISADIVLSGSMEPLFHVGGIVFTDTKDKEFTTGDVIKFQVGESFVTHRITKITKDGYITKGDANEKEDAEMVSISQAVGQVKFYVPLLGYIISFLKKKTVFAVLLLMLLGDLAAAGLQWKGAH